jgi:hypothetical protein
MLRGRIHFPQTLLSLLYLSKSLIKIEGREEKPNSPFSKPIT